jgi:uncharacterized protein involved in copper resistance
MSCVLEPNISLTIQIAVLFAAQGAIPPPACLGIEFQRYRQAAAVLQQQSGAMQHQHHQHMPAAVARDIELLHAEQQQHMHHAAEQASTGSSSSSTSSSPAGTVEGPPEYHGRPGLFQRLQELHAEASERLENQGGPLWFGRAFATRAQANWESMQSMAGQILESMKADLGLPTKEEDPK